MAGGYHGKILEVDLSRGVQRETAIAEEEYRKYLGGSGLAAKIFYERNYAPILPLDAAAPLMVFSGLLTGFNVPTACKASFCGRSPSTGIWAEATVGGYWPAVFKTSGFDGLVITGKADNPVYLYIDERGGAEIKDASALWGKETYETAEKLQTEHGENTRTAAIGPAGEKEVFISSIMVDGRSTRAAGRCGLGALMGSKNLKAIAVQRGNYLPAVHSKNALKEARKRVLPAVREKAKGLSDFGTAGGVPVVEKLGDMPIRNWTGGTWTGGAAKISGQAMADKFLAGHYACFACPIRCGKEMKITVGPHAGSVSHGPEYETAAGFGALCLNEDPANIIAANDLCNRLGIDTISTAAAVAFTMELYEHGLIPEEMLKGIDHEPKWGSGKAIMALIEQIAGRRGIGEYLSRGLKKAAEYFGPPAEEFIVETKGLELPFHDPRAFTSMAVVYATANRGGCHLEGLTYFNENRSFPASMIGLQDEYDPHGIENKALLAKTMQDYMGTFNALGICKFLIRGQVPPSAVAEWTTGVTGWDTQVNELYSTGERLFNLKRMINQSWGISRKDDTLSPRLLVHDRGEGAAAGSLPHLGKMLGEYYVLRGWSLEGLPLPETLTRLGL